MSNVPDDRHYRMLAELLVAGEVVPFLGAGVNLCGRPESTVFQPGRFLPSGSELAMYLAREVNYPYPDRMDLLRVSQYVDRVGRCVPGHHHPTCSADCPSARLWRAG